MPRLVGEYIMCKVQYVTCCSADNCSLATRCFLTIAFHLAKDNAEYMTTPELRRLCDVREVTTAAAAEANTNRDSIEEELEKQVDMARGKVTRYS